MQLAALLCTGTDAEHSCYINRMVKAEELGHEKCRFCFIKTLTENI